MNRIANMIRSLSCVTRPHQSIPVMESTEFCVINGDCITVTFTEWPNSDEIINMNVKVFGKSYNRFVDIDEIEDYVLDMLAGTASLNCELVEREVIKSIDHIIVDYDELSTEKYNTLSDTGQVASEIITLLNYIECDDRGINLTRALPFYDDIVGENVLKRIGEIIRDFTEGELDCLGTSTLAEKFIEMNAEITFDENHDSLIMDTPKGFFMFKTNGEN